MPLSIWCTQHDDSGGKAMLAFVFRRVCDALALLHRYSIFGAVPSLEDILVVPPAAAGALPRVLVLPSLQWHVSGVKSGESSRLPPDVNEQEQANNHLTAASDMWTLGALMYEGASREGTQTKMPGAAPSQAAPSVAAQPCLPLCLEPSDPYRRFCSQPSSRPSPSFWRATLRRFHRAGPCLVNGATSGASCCGSCSRGRRKRAAKASAMSLTCWCVVEPCCARNQAVADLLTPCWLLP